MKLPNFDGSQLCAQVDPELFFPERGDNTISKVAKAICAECPFKKPCAEYALHFEIRGIWGGTSEQDRNVLARKRGITRRVVVSLDMIKEPSETPAAQAKRRARARKQSSAQGAA